MVIRPLAPPNINANAAAVAVETPSNTNIVKAQRKVVSAKRAIHSGCKLRPKANSIKRAPT